MLIIGAGSAGSVVAERLSANPDCRVTVVESGSSALKIGVREQITNALLLPIGGTSSVVRRYATTLTSRPIRAIQLARGKVVGGSGAVNGGYFCRGLPEDFDRWKLPGWAWPDALEHFKAIEHDMDFTGPLHGSDGPIPVRRASECDDATAHLLQTAVDHGYRWIDDLNGPGPPTGVGPVPLNVDEGIRVGPGAAFLAPALDRANLTVLTDTRVDRVRFAGNRAVGVDCVGHDGMRRLTADRIVLCAGAIDSAQLLMLSGVGPPEMLRPLGIPVVAALPVGSRCADHPEWVLPVDWPDAAGRPPVEAVLVTADGVEIRPYTTGFATMIGDRNPNDRRHIGVALMKPVGRGRITLASADPATPPVIEHRYDTATEDVTRLRDGAALVRELVGGAVGEAAWSTSQHLCGTAPMGVDGDDGAVLDNRCRVRGVDGLWVVDASVLPSITSRGPHATVVMIGHRAAEFITGGAGPATVIEG